MKKILIPMIAFIFLAVQGQAQSDAITKYFDKYVEDERFSMVYISPKMFDLVARVELEGDDFDPEIMDIIRELKGLRILKFDGEGASAFYKDALEKINLNSYEELMTVRGKENVHISVKSSGDVVSELLLLIGSSDDFALMSFVGNIDLKKVGKIGKLLDLKGIEHLKDLDKH